MAPSDGRKFETRFYALRSLGKLVLETRSMTIYLMLITIVNREITFKAAATCTATISAVAQYPYHSKALLTVLKSKKRNTLLESNHFARH
jgi:hypothetical protein